MGTVTNTLVDETGRPLQNVTVRISLISPLNPFLLNGAGEVLSSAAVDTDHNGVWSADLVASSLLEQANSYYLVDESAAPDGLRWPIRVPDGAGPFQLRDVLVEVPPTFSPGGPVMVRGVWFHHEQVSPASVWTITHNLGFRPNWRVADSAGAPWHGWTITDPDVNTSVIDLGVSMAGTAEGS